MNEIQIIPPDQQTAFEPGATAEFIVVWDVDVEPDWIELRLTWFTQGKGDRDQSVEDSKRWTRPGRTGEQSWEVTFPAGPFSFSGKLISLQWLLEAEVAGNARPSATLELIVAPGEQEVILQKGAGNVGT